MAGGKRPLERFARSCGGMGEGRLPGIAGRAGRGVRALCPQSAGQSAPCAPIKAVKRFRAIWILDAGNKPWGDRAALRPETQYSHALPLALPYAME